MSKFNIIMPNDNTLSSTALGVLTTMINVPENDYCTDEDIHAAIPADDLLTIREALKELIAKEYVIQLDGCIYAVNKRKIIQMNLI